VEISEIREDGSFRIRVAPGSNYIYLRPREDWGRGRINLRSPWVDVADGQTVEVEFRVRKLSAEELEKERAPWQALNSYVPQTIDELESSANRLKQLGLAIAMYANEHDGSLPDGLQQLEGDVQDQVLFRWLLENVEYMGKGKILQPNAARTPIAYDRTLLQRDYSDYSTEVLFLDSSVRFVGPPELGDLGIVRVRRPTQSEPDASKLKQIGLAVIMYANEHDNKLPDSLQELKPYIGSESNVLWATNNVEYLGQSKCREPADAASTPIAYDKTLLKEAKGTNVLFNDGHVEFVERQKLKELDIGRATILIDARILAVSDAFLMRVGLDPNSLEDSAWSKYLVSNSGGPTAFILDELAADLLLKAVQSREDSKILCSPQILAMEGKQAKISVVSEHYYVVGDYDPNRPPSPPTTRTEKLQLGTFLQLTPALTPDPKSVVLDLVIEVRRLAGLQEHRYRDKYPYQVPQVAVLDNKMNTVVPDGKTLLMVCQKMAEPVSRTPHEALWGDLPLIGGLFRKSPTVEEPKRLLILVKPTIDPQKKAEVRTASRPEPDPLDPNDPLVKELERKLQTRAGRR
jgi:prepilin-type processing-associated H-X9-DG protein